MNRAFLYKCLLAVILFCGAVLLVDTWFDIFTAEYMGKILKSCLILAAVIGAVVAIRNDLDDDDRKKKEGFFN